MKEVSIIIPTMKKKVITDPKTCPVPHETIISRKQGISHARNWGAKKAKHNLLVFLDDDLILKKQVWKYLLNIKHGEFAMYKLFNYPCTRVFSIHKDDFWSIGGFDETINYIGEDRIFYAQAREKGFKCIMIPPHSVTHIPHKPALSNRYVKLVAAIELMRLFVIHTRKVEHNMFKMYLIPLKNRRFWDALMNLFATLYWLVRGV